MGSLDHEADAAHEHICNAKEAMRKADYGRARAELDQARHAAYEVIRLLREAEAHRQQPPLTEE